MNMWNNTWGGFNQGPPQNNGRGSPWWVQGDDMPSMRGTSPGGGGAGPFTPAAGPGFPGIFPSLFGQGGDMSGLMGILAQILGGGGQRWEHRKRPPMMGGGGGMATLGTTPMDYTSTFQAPTGPPLPPS